jgi:hypothetical protein
MLFPDRRSLYLAIIRALGSVLFKNSWRLQVSGGERDRERQGITRALLPA